MGQTEFDLKKIDWEKTSLIFAPEKRSFLRKVKDGFEKYPAVGEALAILAGFRLVGTVLIFPGVGHILMPVMRHWEKQRFKRMWGGLARRKLVEIEEKPDGTVVRITQEGLKKAIKYKASEIKIARPDHWDGKWRVVIFDVSEKKKRARDVFRNYLKNVGFYRLNQSVFVQAFPCFDQVEFLRQISGVGEDVTYIEATKIEKSSIDLEQWFGL